MLNELVLDDAKGSAAVMKYPLRVVAVVERDYTVAIADASGKVIATILDREWGHVFARHVVVWANRWHSLRCWFRPYTKDDWLNEKSGRGVKS